MKICIIHYSKLKDRKDFLNYQINIHHISSLGDIHYITDYDKEGLSDKILSQYYEDSEEKYNLKVANLWDSSIFKYRPLNLPEISCTIKHLEAMKIISEGEEDYGLILEDDCIFYGDFTKSVMELRRRNDFDAVFLGAGCGDLFQKIKINSSIQITDKLFQVHHPATNCAEAYIISKSAAKKIYESAIPFNLVSDWEFAYQFYKHDMKVFWHYPSLVHQGSKNGMYKSTLDLGQRI